MSSQTLTRAKKSRSPRKKKATAPAWMAWWPLLLGLGITLAAVKTAEILPLMGAGGLLRLQLLYPFPLLLKQPQIGLSEQTSETWSQIMLYAQYPLYGLYASVATRWRKIWGVMMQLAGIHLLAFGLLWLLARS